MKSHSVMFETRPAHIFRAFQIRPRDTRGRVYGRIQLWRSDNRFLPQNYPIKRTVEAGPRICWRFL